MTFSPVALWQPGWIYSRVNWQKWSVLFPKYILQQPHLLQGSQLKTCFWKAAHRAIPAQGAWSRALWSCIVFQLKVFEHTELTTKNCSILASCGPLSSLYQYVKYMHPCMVPFLASHSQNKANLPFDNFFLILPILAVSTASAIVLVI